MYSTEDQDLEVLAERFGAAEVFPVVTRMPGDLITPLSAYCALAGTCSRSFLLESVEGGEHLARYSFIGADPDFSVREAEAGLSILSDKGLTQAEGNILSFLRENLKQKTFLDSKDLPNFAGGAVGFLDFDVSKKLEPVLARGTVEKEGGAGSEFMFFRTIAAFDHVRQTVNIVTLVFAEDAGRDKACFRQLLESAKETNLALAERIQGRPKRAGTVRAPERSGGEFRSNFERSEFEYAVSEIKELIRAGECYQVVLSQCFSRETTASPVEIYRALRSLNPSPYMFLMDFGSRAVIGASPEMLVRVRDRHLEYRPIAGTRPRGKDAGEDEAFAADMLADEKELSEHRMLVDLGRNDLGRVSDYGSVKVDDLMFVEKFSHVQHIVSSVSGRLRNGLDGFHALEACFPAGTVSGAPKVRAMEIIEDLEPTARGVYSGAVGYIDHRGDLDTCIAIRTIHLENGVAKVQAGAGIVADSVPSKEFEETIHKARALVTAVDLAESGQFSVGRRAAVKEESA